VIDFLLEVKRQGGLMAQNDRALLIRLKESGLDFVVIGGCASVFTACPQATFDLENICCRLGRECPANRGLRSRICIRFTA